MKKAALSTHNLTVLAYLLVAASILSQGFGLWHRHKVTLLRDQYFDRQGEIDIPEAMYFDSMAFSVAIRVIPIWFLLQLASAIVFCGKGGRVRFYVELVYLVLWLISWGLCLFYLLSPELSRLLLSPKLVCLETLIS
jgi:hypothetical protein